MTSSEQKDYNLVHFLFSALLIIRKKSFTDKNTHQTTLLKITRKTSHKHSLRQKKERQFACHLFNYKTSRIFFAKNNKFRFSSTSFLFCSCFESKLLTN